MRITAYGRRRDGVAYSGESFGVSGEWVGHDRGHGRRVQRIVLDLGRKADRIGRRAVSEDPDVIVLTHDDGDHVSGAPDALWTLDRRPDRQVWLPADWWYLVAAWGSAAGRPPVPGPRPSPTHAGQLSQVAEHDGELPGMVLIDGDVLETRERAEPDQLRDWLEELPWERPKSIDLAAIAAGIEEQADLEGHAWGHEFDGDPVKVAGRVVGRARHIVETVRAAASVAEVRWFAFHAGLSGSPRWQFVGIPGAVTLLNAREMAIPSTVVADPSAMLLQAFRLSVQNRRALVTFVWPTSAASTSGVGGFLNWSDSAGVGCDPTGTSGFTPWGLVDVMSAPHHASAALDRRSGLFAHGAVWDGLRRSPREAHVLLCSNSHPTIEHYTSLPRWRRAATQLDKASFSTWGKPAPVDAGAEFRDGVWRLWGL